MISERATTDNQTANSPFMADMAVLSWAEEDIENKLGFFKGGRYTSVNKGLTFIAALLITSAFFAVMAFALRDVAWLKPFVNPFLRPANTYTMVPASLFFFWGIVILWVKSRKLRFQQRTLELAAVPQQPDFVLNEGTAKVVIERLHGLVDHPKHFILLNRIDRALSNLHNIGGLSDVSTILKGQGENDENQIASSYSILSGMVWAIPVLGFIGTVQGLSLAIGDFSTVLAAGGDLDKIKPALQEVTSGLATAFETTLIALVFALILQLYVNFLQNKETDFLDECSDYCHANVVSKLRLIR